MSLQDSSTSRDPFELDRLVKELDARDADTSAESEDILSGHDFPLYVPLSHDNPYLTSETFNVDDFLLSRSYTSLPDLRAELRDYSDVLKEELVTLINDDYEAFITLSTDLRGEGARLERLKYPLESLRAQMLMSRSELQNIQDTIRDKLKQRSVLRDETALLHLLLKISESVSRLESLLLIVSRNDDNPASPRTSGSLIATDDENIDDSTRGNRAKHLGRVAVEYSQFLYHVSKARAEKCIFINEIQWRIDRIQSTLTSDLDHLFASILADLTDLKRDHKLTEFEKAKRIADLTECLRTYDVLGLWRDAENIIRKEVMRGFVKKTIFPGALSVPHSPIVPHTPFPNRSHSAQTRPPRTPYTPFSAFPSKQTFSESTSNASSLSSASPYAILLDDAEDPLATLYSQIIRFVERDLSRIMNIAENVSIKSVTRMRERSTSGTVDVSLLGKKPIPPKVGEDGFEIMANVIWAELGKAIMDDLGSIVFSVGRPDEFRKHHWTTTAFIKSLEFLAPSARSVETMRSHPVYIAFDRRWQLPVYFQMRWKEIVFKVEDVLSLTRIDPMASKEAKQFATHQAAMVWEAIVTCWNADVFIPELGHRFWKLTLQLLSRYRMWLNASLPRLDHVSKVVVDDASKTSNQFSGTISPAPPTEALSADSNTAHDKLLQQYTAAIVDITSMQQHVIRLWREDISMMLGDTFGPDESDDTNLEIVLQATLSNLTALLSPMDSQIVAILTRRACDALLPVRSIPSQFRAMSNKRAPTEPSYFVPSILRPVKNFFGITGDGPGAPLKEKFMKSYANDVFQNVSQRYAYYLTAMKKTEESLRRLKKGRQTAFSLFGSSTTGQDDDEERIRTQMILDVEAFGRDAESLGVDPTASDAFKTLNGMVHATWLDVPEP